MLVCSEFTACTHQGGAKSRVARRHACTLRAHLREVHRASLLTPDM